MEISEVEIDKINDNKKSLIDIVNDNKYIDNQLKNSKLKVSLLNVDSKDRNLVPKNITSKNNFVLPNNPIQTKINSSTIKIYYPEHEFRTGDLITLNNVISNSKSVSNSLFLFNGFNYLIILNESHGIPINYDNFVDELYIDIELISTPESNFYETIPINMLLNTKKLFTYDQVLTIFSSTGRGNLTSLQRALLSELETRNINDQVSESFIFVELDFIFLNNSNSLYKINDVYKLTFQNLNGIPLNLINSDYPINFYRLNGYKEIINTEENYIIVETSSKAYKTGSAGGDKIRVNKILKTDEGYPNAGEFNLQLRKNFNNVHRLEIISSEFPFTNYLVKENVNNKIYWQHLDDGQTIYSVSIPCGNYSPNNLIRTLTTKMNDVERVGSTPENRIFNNFEISFDTFTNKVELKAFASTLLPNSISNEIVTLNNKEYYKLTILHRNNFVNVGDKITISNSESIGIIPKTSINTNHIIYSVNKSDNTYSILLEPFIPATSTSNNKGGPSVRVKSASSVRYRFDFKDTLGNILNFENPGNEFSITKFNSIVTNFDDYVYSTDLDSVGNQKVNKDFIQLTGDINYWLLYLNNYESIILNSGLENCFSKILLPASQGDTIFNSFINYPVDFDIPLSTLSDLNIKVTDSNGEVVNFQNTNFSFTLKIYELVSTPVTTGKVGTNTSYIKEFIDKTRKDNI